MLVFTHSPVATNINGPPPKETVTGCPLPRKDLAQRTRVIIASALIKLALRVHVGPASNKPHGPFPLSLNASRDKRRVAVVAHTVDRHSVLQQQIDYRPYQAIALLASSALQNHRSN